MATITLKGNKCETRGDLPAIGSVAPQFRLVGKDLSEVGLEDFPGKRVLNVFPSIDTPVCATSLRTFNGKAGSMDGVTVLNISADLPFAFGRFCGAEGLEGVHALSTFRSSFSDDYGLTIVDGPLAGLCSRVVIVVDAEGKVLYTEQVPEITQEPDYEAALAVL